MGAASSKIDDDKALKLCRERKKFIRQALDSRCALASAHVAYIRSLRSTGTAVRKFVQPDAPVESSVYTSTSATPEPLASTEKSFSRLSFPSTSVPLRVETNEHLAPSPSPTMARYQVHHMNFRGSFIRKVEEKPPVVVTGTVTSLSTPQNSTPRSIDRTKLSPPETPTHQPGTPSHLTENSPWDYFGLFHPIDNHLSSHEQRDLDHLSSHELRDLNNSPSHELRGLDHSSSRELRDLDHLSPHEPRDLGHSSSREPRNLDHLFSHELRDLDHDFGYNDSLVHCRPDKEVPVLEDSEEKVFSHGSEGSETDEFDDPSSDTLVRRFKNLNRDESIGGTDASPTAHTVGSAEMENEMFAEEKVSSPKLSPLKTKFSEAATITPQTKVTSVKDDDFEHKIAPKDFLSSMKEVELLFAKASESGKEVPRMLEANKLHFRPLLPGHESGASTTATLLKACFSCGEDPSQVQEEPAQSSVKYLTWHRTTSFRSSSSRNFLDTHSREDVEDFTSDLFENFYLISGSHASTLDRLFAWEKKLFDEVKASQLVRREYDIKCKLLREQESRCESQPRIDKTRAVIKDLHSRIRVAIHRIDSISRRIEVLRDKELQPQLQELIEGLRKMWEVMFECHKLQVHIITVAFSNGSVQLYLESESRRHITLLLEDELRNMALSFTKWINALKSYIQAINDWLNKCVIIQEKSSKKRRWGPPLERRLRNAGPPIYTTCGSWHETLKDLPVKDVADTIKRLATEISHFIPHQEKNHRKKTFKGAQPAVEMNTHDAILDCNTGCDQFQDSFVLFISRLCGFAERSLNMYSELRTNILEAKRNYEHKLSQP